jgi:hypothetical protein
MVVSHAIALPSRTLLAPEHANTRQYRMQCIYEPACASWNTCSDHLITGSPGLSHSSAIRSESTTSTFASSARCERPGDGSPPAQNRQVECGSRMWRGDVKASWSLWR